MFFTIPNAIVYSRLEKPGHPLNKTLNHKYSIINGCNRQNP
jgi:hypothetical protein